LIRLSARAIGANMKLQGQTAYKYKGKNHYKHVVIIPEDDVKKLKWKDGEELEDEVNGKNLTLKPKSKQKE